MNYLDNIIDELESYCFRSPLTVDDEITVDNTEITFDQEIL